MNNRMEKLRKNLAENKIVMPRLMSVRFRVSANLTGILCILVLAGMILGNVAVTPSWGSKKNSEFPVISLTCENLSLKKIFNEIRNKTGYKILFDLDEQSENKTITLEWDNQSLIQGIREIAKKAGLKNFVVITDNENRTLKVFNFDYASLPLTEPIANSDGTGLTPQELAALHEQQRRELNEMSTDPDEIVIPPEGDYPAVTRGQLQALHERQKKEIALRANDPDAIAIPASDDYPALTNRQLQSLHEQQKDQISKMQNNPDEIVIPPEGGYPAVTRSQLRALYERQKKEIEQSSSDPNAIVIPASDDYPAMTKGEIQDLHNRQKRQLGELPTK